jgi:hypothetical protein
MDFTLLHSHQKLFDATTAVIIGTEGLFLFSSFFVASNSYGGFYAVFLGLIAILVTSMSWYGIRRKINRTTYGAVLGAASIFVIVYLQSAIFWGQYSACESSSDRRRLTGVECNHVSAMRAVCAFSVFLFLFEIVYVAILLKYKNEILGSDPFDEGIGSYGGNNGFGAIPDNEAKRYLNYSFL